MGDWQDERQHRFLVHFSDGGTGMRYYDRPPQVGDEISDGGTTYTLVRVEEKTTRAGFGHA